MEKLGRTLKVNFHIEINEYRNELRKILHMSQHIIRFAMTPLGGIYPETVDEETHKF